MNTKIIGTGSAEASQLSAQQSVPPSARAVEAAEEITLLHLHRRANQTSTDAIAAIIQRTCFPPGEGEGWAKAAVAEIFATGRVQNLYPGAPLSTADTLKDIILKHAPARPTAAREHEDTKRLFHVFHHDGPRAGGGCTFDQFCAAIDAAMQQGGKT